MQLFELFGDRNRLLRREPADCRWTEQRSCEQNNLRVEVSWFLFLWGLMLPDRRHLRGSRKYGAQSRHASKPSACTSVLSVIFVSSTPHTSRVVIIRRAACVLSVLAMIGFARAASAQNADVIRGRVIAADSSAIPNATVTVTTISGGVNRSAKTDRNGRFTITFPNGDGDYLVKFVALGYAPKQYELKRAADEDILVANATLGSATNQLDAVHVTAPRDKATRNDVTPDIGGTEKTINTGNLTADQLGDLAAMAASIPGVNYVAGANGDPSGFSVLGLTPDQNSSTLNGMNSGASNLPRDAQTISTVVISPYDVARGGFSAGQQATRLRSGTNFINQGSSLLVEAPPLELTTASARALGQQYTNLSLGGQASGPISIDKAFYNFSYQLGQRSSDLARTPLNTQTRLASSTAGILADDRLRGAAARHSAGETDSACGRRDSE